jgi:hypothetical protein
LLHRIKSSAHQQINKHWCGAAGLRAVLPCFHGRPDNKCAEGGFLKHQAAKGSNIQPFSAEDQGLLRLIIIAPAGCYGGHLAWCQLRAVCDKAGRRNAVKIVCASCGLYFHRTCLVKSQQWTDKELNAFRRDKNYLCWACSVHSFNDSFWSIFETPRAPTPTPAARHHRGKKNAVSLVCFNVRSLKNRRTLFSRRTRQMCAQSMRHGYSRT